MMLVALINFWNSVNLDSFLEVCATCKRKLLIFFEIPIVKSHLLKKGVFSTCSLTNSSKLRDTSLCSPSLRSASPSRREQNSSKNMSNSPPELVDATLKLEFTDCQKNDKINVAASKSWLRFTLITQISSLHPSKKFDCWSTTLNLC